MSGTAKALRAVHSGEAGLYTYYDIVRHTFLGDTSYGMYFEVIEIRDAPPDKGRFVIYIRLGTQSQYFEFRTLADALSSFHDAQNDNAGNDVQAKMPQGFIRRMHCGDENPWFYQV